MGREGELRQVGLIERKRNFVGCHTRVLVAGHIAEEAKRLGTVRIGG